MGNMIRRLADGKSTRAFLTRVDAGFVKRKCDNKAIERGVDSIKT